METNNLAFLKGYPDKVHELHVLEFGSKGSPILERLHERTRNAFYVGLDERYETPLEERFSEFPGPEDSSLHMTLMRHKIQDLPWPIDYGKFDEVHCHMLDSYYLEMNPNSPAIGEKGALGLDQWTDHLRGALKKGGRVFISNQSYMTIRNSVKHPDEHTSTRGVYFPGRIMALVAAMKTDFGINSLQWGEDYLQRSQQEFERSGVVVKPSDIAPLGILGFFTNWSHYVDNFIIATKK